METKNYYPLTVSTNPKIHADGLCSIWSEAHGLAVKLINECDIDIGQQLVDAYNEKYRPKTAYRLFSPNTDLKIKVFCDSMKDAAEFVKKTKLEDPNRVLLIQKWNDKMSYDIVMTLPTIFMKPVTPEEFNKGMSKQQQEYIDKNIPKLHEMIICIGQPETCRHEIIQASTLLNNFNDAIECALVYVDKIIPILKERSIVIVFQNNKGFLYHELLNKCDAAFVSNVPKENSAHSFTDGMDSEKLYNPLNEIGEQNRINNLKEVDVRERWNQVRDKSKPEPSFKTTTVEDMAPDFEDAQFQMGLLYRSKEEHEKIQSLVGSARLVDVQKVIEDLIPIAENYLEVGGEDVKKHEAIQNAEAALGMLQAFKQERGSIGTPLEKKCAVDPDSLPPLKEGKLQKIQYSPGCPDELYIRNKLRQELPIAGMVGQDERMMTANAVLNAIDEMIKLRGL